MQSILVYGDSIVWGRNAKDQSRHSFADRWPNVLGSRLTNALVWEAGLGGRTTNLENPGKPGRNGLAFLPVALLQAAPIDLVILALGTNDPFAKTGIKPQETAEGMRKLIKEVRNLPYATGTSVPGTMPPKVMIVSPPNCLPLAQVTGNGNPEQDNLREWLPELALLYKKLAIEEQAYFLDAATYCNPDPIDGIHLDAENTRNLGCAVAQKLIQKGFAISA